MAIAAPSAELSGLPSVLAWRRVRFTLIVSIALALVFAWAPRLGFLADPVRAMASGGGRATGNPGRKRAQRALVVSQLAASFMLLIGAGLLTRSLLQELGLQAWLKTSGGKGLHVVVPLSPRYDWATVKDFSQAVVQHLARVIPGRFVAKSGPANRVGRIFVDDLRNSLGATSVADYSARARPGLGVSMPVSWDALDSLKSGAQWTVATAREHLSFHPHDPWSDYWTCRQTLTQARKILGAAAA